MQGSVSLVADHVTTLGEDGLKDTASALRAEVFVLVVGEVLRN